VGELRDSISRDTDDQQDTDDVQRSSLPLSGQTPPAEDLPVSPAQLDVVEPQPSRSRPLFEDISDAEDEPATPPRAAADLSPVSMFHSPFGSASTSIFDGVQSWSPCRVPDNDCSSSLPHTAVSQFLPAVSPALPDVSFCPARTSPPPPSLEDLSAAGVLVTGVMSPLTIDVGVETTAECRDITDDVDASKTGTEVADIAQQQADDVTDTSQVTSCVTSDVSRSPQPVSTAVTEEQSPPATTSISLNEVASTTDASLSPSPPKIPRLRIVMGAGDAAGQLTGSPGNSAASLPYVVTVDNAVAEQPASPGRDVIDDVTESSSPPLVESLSRRKMKNGASAKVRLVIVNLSSLL